MNLACMFIAVITPLGVSVIMNLIKVFVLKPTLIMCLGRETIERPIIAVNKLDLYRGVVHENQWCIVRSEL